MYDMYVHDGMHYKLITVSSWGSTEMCNSPGYHVFSRHSLTVCSDNELYICSSEACELPLHYWFVVCVDSCVYILAENID